MKMTKRMLAMLLLILAGSFIVAGFAFAEHHVVKVAKKSGVGRYLTDIKGKTLYCYKKDSSGKSVCLGECVVKWPIFYKEEVAVKGGLDASRFGAFTRADGKKQTTYKGMPLYYSKEDKIEGDMIGQGFEDAWFIVAP